MDITKHSISIIMPAYNEEPNLEKAVVHTLNTFQSLNLDFEIFIVNDHSFDKTGEIAERLAAANNVVKVFHHEENQGAGNAFKTGISHATKDFVIFVPFDNPLDKEDIEAYLPWMDVCDIVVGCRVERVGYSHGAHFASFIYNRIMVPLLFNIGISDVNWIQVYKRELFTNGKIEFRSKSFFFFVEILVRARRNRLLIIEVPARMKKRLYGKPTYSDMSAILKVLREMLTFFWFINREEEKQ